MTARRFVKRSVPLTETDRINRRAAAQGSLRYAALAEHADYNGHAVSLTWNTFRKYWVGEYYRAGRRVIARGAFGHCLDACMDHYNRGQRGTVIVAALRNDGEPPETVEEQERLCLAAGLEECPPDINPYEFADSTVPRDLSAPVLQRP